MGSYLTTLEAAELLNCSERNIQILCKRGMIPSARKVRGIWLIPEKAVLSRKKLSKPSPAFRAEALYGVNAKVHLTPSGAEAQMEESGCSVTQYPILEGISLVFQDIHQEHIDYGDEIPTFPPELIAIQHCRGEVPAGSGCRWTR